MGGLENRGKNNKTKSKVNHGKSWAFGHDRRIWFGGQKRKGNVWFHSLRFKFCAHILPSWVTGWLILISDWYVEWKITFFIILFCYQTFSQGGILSRKENFVLHFENHVSNMSVHWQKNANNSFGYCLIVAIFMFNHTPFLICEFY